MLLCAAAGAQNQPRPLIGHVRPAVASGHAPLIGSLPSNRQLSLSLVLPLRNPAQLSALLQRLYDPASPDYRRFLTTAEFTARFAPSPEEYQSVVAFARANGFEVDPAPANRRIVSIRGTAAQIERAFHVRMNLYRHPTENRAFYSPDREPPLDPALPIAHIAGLNDYSLPRPLLRRPAALAAIPENALGSGPQGSFLASDMRAAYYGGTALTGDGQTLALVEFDGYDRADVDLTFQSVGQSYRVPIQNVLLDGADGTPVQGDDAEEVLDIAQAIGMAPGLSAVRVYIGTSDADILNAIAAENLAQQVSISWTWSPDDPAIDDEFFAEMAAQGQSVFAASGDAGEFDPLMENFYPAEDAYVTSVGGTRLATQGPAGPWLAETAWTYSGGGISPDQIGLPAWQAGIATSANGGSTTLRNVPDVAMEADFDNYACDMGLCSAMWAGTSFAAPRWAAFAALANQQAAAAGEPALGFLNPALYALGESSAFASDFHDIVQGNNNADGSCCGQQFFYALPGYDLVTGWGSPAGQPLIDALAPPALPRFQLSASPRSLDLDAAASAATVLTVLPSGAFASNVTLSVAGPPTGVTAAWSANPASATSVLTLSASTAALRGASLLTITGTSGSTTASTTLALQVNAPGFSMAPANPTMQLFPGASASNNVVVTRYAGFAGDVHFSVTSDLPRGVTASWLDNPATGLAELTLTADNTTNPNRAMVTITGASGNLSAVTTIALTIDAPQYILNLSPYPLALGQGESEAVSVSVVPIGSFSGPVAISAPELPPNVFASFSPATTTAASTLTLTAGNSASLGNWPVDIHGSAAQSTTDSQFTQTITAGNTPRFDLVISPPQLSIARGASATGTIQVREVNRFSAAVTLAATNLPDGITAAWSQNPTADSSILTLTASSTAFAGPAFPILLDGSAGSLRSRAMLYLSVNPAPSTNPAPAISSLTPAFLSAGGAAFSITVNGAGFTPASIVSWANTPLATQYLSGTQLTAKIPAANIAQPGIADLTVQNPPPGGGASNAFQLEMDSAAAGRAAPVFAPSSSTVTAGAIAVYAVTLPANATTISIQCLNLPAGASCAYAAGAVRVTTAANSPKGFYTITVVFTETEPVAAATILVPILLLPWLLFVRRRLRLRLARSGDALCLVLVAAALVSACSSGAANSPSSAPPVDSTHSVTSSGVVTLTIQ